VWWVRGSWIAAWEAEADAVDDGECRGQGTKKWRGEANGRGGEGRRGGSGLGPRSVCWLWSEDDMGRARDAKGLNGHFPSFYHFYPRFGWLISYRMVVCVTITRCSKAISYGMGNVVLETVCGWQYSILLKCCSWNNNSSLKIKWSSYPNDNNLWTDRIIGNPGEYFFWRNSKGVLLLPDCWVRSPSIYPHPIQKWIGSPYSPSSNLIFPFVSQAWVTGTFDLVIAPSSNEQTTWQMEVGSWAFFI
jgi:hypothetical protein